MLGMDGDRKRSFEELYSFSKVSGLKIPVISILVPVPGTKIFNEMKCEGRLLINDEKEFAEDNPLYSVPSNLPFFVPKHLTSDELREEIKLLGRKMYSLWNVLSRAVCLHPGYTAVFLKINMDLRRKYYAMK